MTPPLPAPPPPLLPRRRGLNLILFPLLLTILGRKEGQKLTRIRRTLKGEVVGYQGPLIRSIRRYYLTVQITRHLYSRNIFQSLCSTFFNPFYSRPFHSFNLVRSASESYSIHWSLNKYSTSVRISMHWPFGYIFTPMILLLPLAPPRAPRPPPPRSASRRAGWTRTAAVATAGTCTRPATSTPGACAP